MIELVDRVQQMDEGTAQVIWSAEQRQQDRCAVAVEGFARALVGFGLILDLLLFVFGKGVVVLVLDAHRVAFGQRSQREGLTVALRPRSVEVEDLSCNAWVNSCTNVTRRLAVTSTPRT
jgi:hypothetical protein